MVSSGARVRPAGPFLPTANVALVLVGEPATRGTMHDFHSEALNGDELIMVVPG
jgi:hypothetical protein